MSPDDHTREADRLLNDAADLTARDTAEPTTPALLVQMAHVHALLAQRPQPGTVWHERTTDSMMKFASSEGLDDIREWHADAAPKADQLDDFDAWLHVRDVGKLLNHIEQLRQALSRRHDQVDRHRFVLGDLTASIRAEIADVHGLDTLDPHPRKILGACDRATDLIAPSDEGGHQ